MAKENSSKEDRRKAKKEKKEKKRLAEEAGVQKHKKKDKDKEKKKSKESKDAVSAAVLNVIENESEAIPASVTEDILVEEEEEEVKPLSRPIGALVPFANPLADEKVAKKCFRGVKKAAAHRVLKRGVKEVVKSLRKSPLPRSTISTLTSSAATVAQTPSSVSSADSGPPGIVILAADISPLDVISHIPVLCEDHSIPYVYVTSRAELGIAGGTKRPTSVVLIGRETAEKAKKTKRKKEEGEENGDVDGDEKGGKGETAETKDDWAETFRGLVRLVDREQARVRI